MLTNNRENCKVHDDSSLSDDDFGYLSDDDDIGKFGYGHGFPQQRFGQGGDKDNYDYGTDIGSDENTYEYSEIANDAKYGYKGKGQISGKDGTYGKHSERNDRNILGVRHILHSLSSARTLELLTDAREVYGCHLFLISLSLSMYIFLCIVIIVFMEHLFLIFPKEMFAHPNRPYMSSEHITYIFSL
jgi:hypothetical protein